MDNFTLGAVPSPYDERDYIARTFYHAEQKYPPLLDYRDVLLPVRNQGNQGACVAFSACVMKEWQEKQEDNLSEYLSPQYIYNWRANKPNSGMNLRNCMQILQQRGVCLEQTFPYQQWVDFVDGSATEEANNFKITKYARVNTIEDLKIALFKSGPCIVSFPVYNYGMHFWKSSDPKQVSIGGHAVAIIGYTEDSFIIQNSWSSKWGNNGYTYYPFADWGSHWEIWTTIDDDSEVLKHANYDQDEPEPEPLPVPVKKRTFMCFKI